MNKYARIGIVVLIVLGVYVPAARTYAAVCANDGSLTFVQVNGQCQGYITTAGSGTFKAPSDWTNTNTIEVVGAGGNGGNRSNAGGGSGGGGGGGGAYARATNVTTISPFQIVSYTVGAINTATALSTANGSWFCNSQSNCTATNSSAVLAGAESGTSGNTTTAGSGGASASGTGGVNSGGAGGTGGNTGGNGGGGGGGAAGPDAVGGNGVNSGSCATNCSGGFGDGQTSSAANGTQYSSSPAIGFGGGGTGLATGNGTAAGTYGAGGGGAGTASGNTGGSGTVGLIVITYTPPSARVIRLHGNVKFHGKIIIH